MYIGRDIYRARLVEYVREEMYKNGFIRPSATNSELAALKDALPDYCVRYSITAMLSASVFSGGYYFRSPQPCFDAEQILQLARGLRKNTGETLRNAIRRITALTDDDVKAFVVANALSEGDKHAANRK